MVQKNEYYDVSFVDMTHDGMGICKIDGFAVFVKDALKGESANIKITKVGKSFGFGIVNEMISESPFRKKPICDHYYECGGCNLMHMNYQMQLDFKKHRTKETLRKLGRIETKVNDTVGMANPYYYRNKAVVPFGERNGKLIAGLYKPRSHDIVDIKRCYIIPKIDSDIIKFLKTVFNEIGVSAYDEETHTGVIKNVIIRSSHKYDDISVTIVTYTSKLPKKEVIIQRLVQKFSRIKSIVHNINSDKTNVIFGKKSKILFGEDLIRDEINGILFEISHKSFYQVNPVQTEELYKKAISYAELTGNEVVVDAFCGIGTIGLTAAPFAKTVLGMDVVKSSIENAKRNAINNKITNARFVTGKAEKVIKDWKNYDVDVLFIDPPRKGVEREFLETIVEMKVKRIVYISCNVSTLARDLNFLQGNDYIVEETTPYDMFPQTNHIESVTKLTLRKTYE